MIVQHFVRWCETAGARQRAEGVSILARALVEDRVPSAELDAALSALTLMLDDPSPKVRLAMAAALAAAPRAPRQLMLALAEDIDEIACLVAASSPVLSDGDLIDLAAGGSAALQIAIAGRAAVSMRLAAALAEIGCRSACAALLRNDGAAIASVSHRRMAERIGEDAGVRSLMLERCDIPADVRQTLILHLGRALAALPIVRRSLGEARAQRMALDACERATAMLASSVRTEEIPALVEHLRISGQLSTAFLIRIVCHGNIDLFAAAMVQLSGLSERRVRAIVVDGREGAFNALVASAGLPTAAALLLRSAVQAWKQAIAHRAMPEAGDLASEVMAKLVQTFRHRRNEPGFEAVGALLNRLEAETLRGSARQKAQRMAAAA